MEGFLADGVRDVERSPQNSILRSSKTDVYMPASPGVPKGESLLKGESDEQWCNL